MNAGKSPPRETLSPIEGEIVDFMVRLFRIVGLPKTLGSIYGYVYASRRPVAMDDLIQGLGISAGSASQGLRTLKVFRAVRPAFVQGDRRERFEAELDFQRFLGDFLAAELESYIENTEKRTSRIAELLEEAAGGGEGFYRERLERLESMKERTKRLVPMLREVFSSQAG